MSFEVGSPVRVITEDAGDYFERIAVIAKVEGAIGFWLDFQGKEPPLYFSRNEVEEVPGWEWELLHPDKPLINTPKRSLDYSDWPDDTEKQEVEPSYYDFPQGIEVRHISAHLTSFGGQALQYVARSTRLDGRNKGNPIEDLTKALDFIQWEIDRLRELE